MQTLQGICLICGPPHGSSVFHIDSNSFCGKVPRRFRNMTRIQARMIAGVQHQIFEFSKHDLKLSVLVLIICSLARSTVRICLGKAHLEFEKND